MIYIQWLRGSLEQESAGPPGYNYRGLLGLELRLEHFFKALYVKGVYYLYPINA